MTTAEQLRRIEARLAGRATERGVAPVRAREGDPRMLEPIAIVGVAGFLPGCGSVREFWRALEEDRCLLTEIPRDRFDWREVYDPTGRDPRRSSTKWGGFLPDVRGFDPEFFKMTRSAADVMDPRQRLLLMAVYQALEDAGWAPGALRGSRTGVFVAAEDNEYLELLRSRHGDWGDGIEETPGMIANRIAHHFDFRGPSDYINTLCSGGAVALHRAVQSLRAGEVNAAIVGAANVILRPEPFVQMTRLGQLSPTADVRSFGKDAQGHQRAEAVISVVLKPLARAEADGDAIYALIKHSAVSHTGRGGLSLTAPDPTVHAELIRGCADAAGLDPRRLSYIEAQGMGNPLSDLAEWRAFNLALHTLARERGVGLRPGGCVVGTLKPLAGHMEAASSLAALLKIVHGLRTRRIFGIHGFTECHEELDTEAQPCALATRTMDWPQEEGPRVAGLHAHGISGNNAHLLIEEYVAPRMRARHGIGARSHLIALSAPTESALATVARNLAEWLQTHRDVELAEVAFTLQVGRDVFACRWARVVRSVDELVEGLRGVGVEVGEGDGRGDLATEGTELGRRGHRGFRGAGDISGRRPEWSDLEALGRFWAAGGEVPWAEGQAGRRGQRISLPTYPFKKDVCWFDREEPADDGKASRPEEIRARLIALVAEELKRDPAAVEPERHFLELGIDSLAGLRLAQRFGRSLGIAVRLRDWLEHPTVEAYARFLTGQVAERRAEAGAGEMAEASEVEVTESMGQTQTGEMIPLSECQRGLWALQQMRPESVAYHVPLAVRTSQRLEVERLRVAARRVLERHPLLACRVEQVGGELRHVRAQTAPFVEESDLSGASATEIETALEERLRRKFELATGPLVRFHLLQVAGGQSVLLLAFHHLVVDGLSTAPILATLIEAYGQGGGEKNGRAGRSRFGEFVRWERAQLAGESGARLKAFWQEQLAGELPGLSLFAEAPTESSGTEGGAVVSVPLERGAARGLVALAREARATVATVLLGVWQTLLHRYSGQDEVVVGMPTQVRPDERFAEDVGYFLNVLPIRGRALGERTFAELVQTLQRTMADAIDHAAYPFPRMVRDLGLTAAEETGALVQVGFEFQNFAAADAEPKRDARGVIWQALERPRQAGEHGLVLEVAGRGETFELHFKFDRARYGEGAVRRLAEHFCALADSVVRRPDLTPGTRAMLGDAEARRILTEWNATEREFPREACAHELFERQAREMPEAVAVRWADRTMTYRELDERSGVLARHLQQLGVGADTLVAICMERSPEMVVGLLAILKAGGAYVPLDPSFPVERLAFMAKDSHAGVILTDSRIRKSITSWLEKSQNGILRVVVEVDGEWVQIAASAAGRELERRATAEHLAYVIYTSGSTGTPKGVMIPHRALVNLLLAMAREPGLARGERLLSVTTLSFDIAGLELFLPLVVGAECCLATAGEVAEVEALKRAIARVRPALMQATPSAWRTLLHAGWRNEERVRLLCGGEAMPEDLARAFGEGGMEVWNMYGPTETTIWSTSERVGKGTATGIGRPIANTRVFVVDARGNPLPAGVAGELLIGGEGLARGYWQRPELTAERFVELPFRRGERLYRTGDLACWREDGTLQYLGRTDHQVKVRGHRIELGEIETQLGRHPTVGDCAVVVREVAGSRQIVAYYVGKSADGANGAAGEGEAEALLAHLRRQLPGYMVPALAIRLEALPLTLNGKKDRKTLAARAVEVGERQSGAGVAESELEARVLRLWRELLRVENLRATDGFFAVGGDSVSAVVLAARIGAELGVPFTVTDLFRCATVRAICAELTNKVGGRQTADGAGKRSVAGAVETVRAGGATVPDYYADSLAIVGISCRFPGAEDHRAFWANLRAGVDSGARVSEEELRRAGVPERVRGHRDFVPVRMTIEGKDEFDPDFFKIPTKNAALMDPQFRLLLMHAWQAIEDAGYVPQDLAEAGVFMTVSNSLYASALIDAKSDLYDTDNYVSWLMAQEGSVATMISYQLGLRGPSYAVHANCASSLVALHAAWQSLRAGDVRCALVGAASVLPETSHGYLNRPGLNTSSDGRCRAFDAAADGIIGGEGLAVLVLKRASDAVADGDNIYALVRGVGVTNDGADKVGFYAPGVGGHVAAIEKALRMTGVAPGSVSYIEAHGTGTKLGDPVEVAALGQAYRAERAGGERCGLGSVKTNIGHLDTAAGLAGCIKVALSLKHRELPPTLHFRTPNPELKLEESPFQVVDTLRAWPAGKGPRRAGLSSLGIGGTNTHAILEEWGGADAGAAAGEGTTVRAGDGEARAELVVLSAANEARLRESAENLARFLEGGAEGIELADIAYTLQVGRVAMAARVAFLAASKRELADKLAGYLGGGAARTGTWAGEVGEEGGELDFLRGDEGAATLVERWVAERKLAQLAQYWVRGGVVAWRGLFGAARPRRVSLPGYPFARERFRPSDVRRSDAGVARGAVEGGAAGAGEAVKRLHPLLHENLSTLHEQRYRTTLAGTEFFLADHRVRGEPLLPAVAYLEMARAAVAHAAGAGGIVRLQQVAWVRPVTVAAGPRALDVVLAEAEDGAVRFEILSAEEKGGAGAEAVVVCQGVAVRDASTAAEGSERREVRTEEYGKRYGADACYQAFRALGMEYGPAHRGIAELWADGDRVLARLVLPEVAAETLEDFTLHPALLDAAVQASIGFGLQEREAGGAGGGGFLLPFALEEIELRRPLAREMWARVARRPAVRAGAETLDIEILDTGGEVCARLRGFFSRAAGEKSTAGEKEAAEVWLSAPAWRRAEPAVRPREFAERRVVLCGVSGPVGRELGALPAEAAERFGHVAREVFREAKAMLESKPREDVLLQVVVARGAGLEGIAGLLRSAGLEQPRLFAQVVEVGREIEGAALADVLARESREAWASEVRWEGGQRTVRVEEPLAGTEARRLPWRDEGVYLITGGGGALAWIFAEEIVRRTSGARVVLAGRSALSAEGAARIGALGGRVSYRQADVTRRAEVEALVAAVRADFGGLNGVLHAAGVIRDNFVLRKTGEELEAVLAPKVAGAVNLDAAIGGGELDFLVLFSSLAGALGSAGQADYAAANAFLDAFAEERAARVSAGERRGRTLAIGWPLWRDGGMRAAEGIEQAQSERTGFRAMGTREGLEAFYRALATERAAVAVWCGERGRVEAYLGGLARGEVEAEPKVETGAAPDDRLAGAALEFLRGVVAKMLERPAHRIKDAEKFERYGLDSILAVQLTNELEKHFGVLPKTLFFEYQSLGELRNYFVEAHREKLRAVTGVAQAEQATQVAKTVAPVAQRRAVAEPAVVKAAESRPVESTDVAIVGIVGRYPQAGDIEQFWENLKAGRDAITEVPAERWDWRKFGGAGKWGGFLEGIDRFDPQLFNMAPKEAELVDPQERLFLETVWNLLESVGYTRATLRERYGGRVGVFVGSMYQHYHAFRSDELSEAVVSLSSFSGIANRVSYFFDLQGPSVAVDTMCSSAIVAIQMACDSLRSGESMCAIAGGVNLSLHPKKFVGLTASKLMGTRAESRAFAEGDGYLPAEGVGAVLLKPLARAIEDGDQIWGVIKAATTNHSGQSGGFAVPNPQAQAQALVDCVARAGVELRTIGYVESAANGSPLGDAVEIKALRAAFGGEAARGGDRRIGSVKSNIGHAEAASGMAQVAKVLLQLRHRQLVPTILARPMNPNIDFGGAPFRLQEELEEWKRPVGEVPLRAVIQSVGAGGSTAHLVIEEYPGKQDASVRGAVRVGAETSEGDERKARLVVLSARTRERLGVVAENLLRRVETTPELRLADVAHTLMFGREAMDHRAALVVRSRAELVPGLRALVAQVRGETGGAGATVPLFVGDVDAAANPAWRELFGGEGAEGLVKQWVASRTLEKLAAWWTQGGDVAWAELDEKREGQRVALPTYPFERRRCWIREIADVGAGARAAAATEGVSAEVEVALSAGNTESVGVWLKTRVGELLGLAAVEVSATKPLNALGFTSLDAVNLKTRIEQAFGVEVPLAALNAFQTLGRIEAELAGRGAVARAGGEAKVAGAEEDRLGLTLRPAARFEAFPLTDIQESFIAGRQLGGREERTGCHIYFEIEVPGLDLYRLNVAWNRLIARHDMLRAVFLADGTQQVRAEVPAYRIKAIDLRRLTEDERMVRRERMRETMSHRVHDPAQWPLFEVSVSLGVEGARMHFSIDELIVDAASIDVLFQEWKRLYEKPEEAMPALELTFRDYVLAQREFAASARYARDMAYWVEKLRGMPGGPKLPRGSGEVAGWRCVRLEATLAEAEWGALKRRAEAAEVSPTALLLGMFAEVLRTRSEEAAFCLILTSFNRLPLHPEVERIVGPLISTNLFLASEPAAEALTERLRAVQEALWSDLDRTRVSGIAVLRELGRRKLRPAAVALPVVFTSMLGNRMAGKDTLLRHLTYSVTQTPQVYLDHQLYEEAGELRFSWDVVREYFAPGLVEELFETYVRLLRRLAAEDAAWVGAAWRGQVAAERFETRELTVDTKAWAEPFALTDQQQAYAFGRTEHGGGKAVNVYVELDAAELDVARLEAAWRRVVARHPMLRTVVRTDGRQQVRGESDLPRYAVRVDDFAELGDAARKEALAAVAREMTARVCPLGEWPHFEVRVSRLGGGAARVHLCVDMIVADGASIDRLVQELLEIYERPEEERAAVAVTFRDYVQHLQALRGTEAFAAAVRYWNEKFADLPAGPVLPRGVGAGVAGETGARRVMARIAGWETLRQRAAEVGVAPGMVLFTAFADVLWEHAGRRALTIVVPCWERPALHPELGRVVGDFTAMSWVVVRGREGSFAERVVVNHRAVQADLGHWAASGLQVLRRIAAKRGIDKRLSFPVVFTNLSTEPPLRLPAGFTLGQAVSQTPGVELDNMTSEFGDQLELCWDVANGAYADGVIEAMFAEYRRMLETLAVDANAWRMTS